MVAKYSKAIIIIHWLSFLLILGIVFTGVQFEEMPDNLSKLELYKIHFCLGFLVLILTLLRIYFFFAKPRPPKPLQISEAQVKLIHFVHISLYVILFVLGITGLAAVIMDKFYLLIQSQNIADFPKEHSLAFLTHHIVSKIFFLLMIMHLVGVVLHYFRHKENMLKRIF